MVNGASLLGSVATAVIALFTALARSEAIENNRKETVEKKERAEFERLIQEREESRRRKHQKQIMEFEKRRRELEEDAKRADLKDKEHKRQLDAMLRVLNDTKEMGERREAVHREKFDKFMAEREKIENEKDELIAEKDKALDEKDKFFQEYRKMTEENEEINRKRYEEHQSFEEILRKMQSLAVRHVIANPNDENVKKLCLDFTNVVDSYEGPHDIPKIKQSLQGFGRALMPSED